MSNHIVPCERPENDPEDWFIERDGKQYPDDEMPVPNALKRRRHAKDACHTECYFRLQCLDLALQNPTPATYGTWGGYYPEELREIRKVRDDRAARRSPAVD